MTDPCPLCADVANRGGRSHCRTCHATWGMTTKTMHCVTCHETFSTPANCDRHQKGTKTEPWGCRPPAERGLVADPNAHGTMVWHQTGDGWRTQEAHENMRVSAQSASEGTSATPVAQEPEIAAEGLFAESPA